jgi:transposase
VLSLLDNFTTASVRAVWHKAQSLQILSNRTFAFIPPYTPEMNPIEQVWSEIRKRGFKNKAFKFLLAVIDQLEKVIRGLSKECLKSIVNRQWTNAIFDV